MNPVLRGFLRKEFLQIIREPRVLAMVFVAPVLQLVLLGYALSTEMRNIKLAVIAAPGDIVMTRIAERAYSSGWFVQGTADPADPVSSLKSRRAEVVLIAPRGGLTRSLAREMAPFGVLVNAVNPGFIHTELTQDVKPELLKEMLASTILKREGEPEEVAGVVAFLCSDWASYMSGQIVNVDGGLCP